MNDTSLSVPEKVETFFSTYRRRHYSKGQVLMLEGENTHTVYYLLTGRVKVYDVTYRGDEMILNVFKPPAFFPMALAINEATPNRYIYEAETDIELHQAPANAVVDFLKTNPDVMFDLLGRLYNGVEGLMTRMSLLMGSSAKHRLMYELLLEAKRFGAMQDDGSCLLQINEKGLGARAGLSRETVSREVAKLKQDGLLRVHAKTILLPDISQFELMLGQEI